MAEESQSPDTLPILELPPARRPGLRNRCAAATAALLDVPGPAGPLLGWAHDLSRCGVGLLVADAPEAGTPPDAGTRLDVELLTPRGAGLRLPARVAHATRLPSGRWLVGCAFLGPVREEDLDPFL
jgi:hypothetical protein